MVSAQVVLWRRKWAVSCLRPVIAHWKLPSRFRWKKTVLCALSLTQIFGNKSHLKNRAFCRKSYMHRSHLAFFPSYITYINMSYSSQGQSLSQINLMKCCCWRVACREILSRPRITRCPPAGTGEPAELTRYLAGKCCTWRLYTSFMQIRNMFLSHQCWFRFNVLCYDHFISSFSFIYIQHMMIFCFNSPIISRLLFQQYTTSDAVCAANVTSRLK